jgi:hypothetical protein
LRVRDPLLGRFLVERQRQLQPLFARIVGNQDLAPVELRRRIAGFRRLAHVLVGQRLVALDDTAFHQDQRIFEHRRRIAAFGRLAVPEGGILGIALDAEAGSASISATSVCAAGSPSCARGNAISIAVR